MCQLNDFRKLELDDNHRIILEQELEFWHAIYLPVGKTVLDLGAGCGETALFYLNHGAEKVISIESDSKCYSMLCNNFAGDSRVIPIHAHIDSIKCDIEGGERDAIIETHFPFKFIQLRKLTPNVKIWKIKEDWGNVAIKGLRKMRTLFSLKQ